VKQGGNSWFFITANSAGLSLPGFCCASRGRWLGFSEDGLPRVPAIGSGAWAARAGLLGTSRDADLKAPPASAGNSVSQQ
jgi:hypothetical protein